MSPGLRISCRTKRELFVLTKLCPNEVIMRYYKKYCNILKKLIQSAKEMHVSRSINKSGNKIKTTWKIIKGETSQCQPFRNFELKNNDLTEITDPDAICTTFNNYFGEIAQSLRSNFGNNNSNNISNNTQLPISIPTNSLYIKPVSEAEIIRIINELNNTTAVGCDDIPITIIKQIANFLSTPLQNIINSYLEIGTFPDRFKISKIIPLHKRDATHNVQNYRPISILPALSKVFEKVMHSQLLNYLTKNKLISPSQHGFLHGKSTTTALVDVMNTVFHNTNQRTLVACIVCDLSKAFDMVDHEILKNKLQLYGIRGIAFDLFASYLEHRVQYTEIKHIHDNGVIRRHSSQCICSAIGVPQGSIMGPLLFLLFINDLPSSVTSQVVLYADDTNAMVTGSTEEELLYNLQTAWVELEQWFHNNKLILNRDKTKIIVFNQKEITNVTIGNIQASTVLNCKLLGLAIASTLDWQQHITNVVSKLNQAIYVLINIKKICNNIETLKMLYFAYFNSHVNYGLLFWGSDTNARRILLLQKKALRIIMNLSPRESVRHHFKAIGIPTIFNQYIQVASTYIHENRDKFHTNSEIHTYNTRYPQYIRCDLAKSSKFYNSYISIGIKIYNALPNPLKNDSRSFKLRVQEFLNEYTFYSLDEFFNQVI